MSLNSRRTLLFGTAIIMLAFIIAFVYPTTVDWNQARPYINQRVSTTIGREFVVRGNLNVKLIPGSNSESVWERYITALPLLQISADDVQLANPAWSHVGPTMASAQRVVATLRPFALLGGRVIISELDLDSPQLALERRPDGSNNWSLQDSGPSVWAVQIQRLAFADGTVRFLDSGIQLDMHAKASSVAGGPTAQTAGVHPQSAQQFDLQFVVSGNYHHAPVTGSGKLGSVLNLDDKNTVFPLQAHMQIGTNSMAVDGVITDPRAPSGVNIKLALGGNSLADLFPLTGVLLPETAPYKVSGRLLGQKEHNNWNWTYQQFAGTVGSSDLEGTLEYVHQTPRPMLRGTITSKQLRLDDLGPIIGTNTGTNALKNAEQIIEKVAGKTPATTKTAQDKALPTGQFHTSQWSAIDTDIKFSGQHLIRTHDIPLDGIVANIHLTDSVVRLDPLYFGMAGGDVTSNIVLDGHQPVIAAQIKLALRNVQLRELFPNLQSMHASFGEINGDAALTGHGNSIAQLLGSSNGEFVATVNKGSVSRYMLEEAGLNLANVLFVKMFGDKQVQLNCLVSDFAVSEGIARSRHFFIDTEDAVINVTGDVDMAQEQLNLDVRPITKSIRVLSLRTPLYVKGTFEHPDVGLYKIPLTLKVGAAIGLAFIAPPAAALATVNMGSAPVIDCPAELSKALRTRSAPQSEATASPAEHVSKKEIQTIRTQK